MWYAVISQKTGDLLGVGEVIPDPMPKDRVAIELGEDFDQEIVNFSTWDTVNHTFNFIPQKSFQEAKQERVDLIASDLKLTDEQKIALEKYL